MVLFMFLYFFPFPSTFKAAGVVKADEYMVAVNDVDGYVDQILVKSGSFVDKGDPLIRLTNKELEFSIRETKASLKEFKILRQQAMRQRQADIKPITRRIQFFEEKQAGIDSKIQRILLR